MIYIKNITLYSLLFLILSLHLFIPYLIFKVKQTCIRNEIKNTIKHGLSENEMMCFSQHEIKHAQWNEINKEFWLNGNIYDVVKITYKNGIKFYWCINDNKEKRLFATLDNIVNKRMHDYTPKILKKIIGIEWLCNYNTISFCFNSTLKRICKTYILKLYFADVYLIPPPPEII